MAKGKGHPIHFNFDEQSYQALQELHRDYGRDDQTKLAVTLRDTLVLAIYVSRQIKRGWSMQFERGDRILEPPADMLPGRRR